MRMIGIDPGSRFTGYGIIERHGSRLVHIASGRINVSKRGTPLSQRLEGIYAGLSEIIALHKPESAGIEGIFYHRNAASALTLGHARGVAMLACCHGGMSLGEYPPMVVKKAVVGSGRADKDQVQHLVRIMLGLGKMPLSEDESDALAIALCHAQHYRPNFKKKSI